MIPTNPADELENLIPNRRSVELFFSKGVYLKGFSMNGHQFPVASILLKNKNKTLKTSGDLGDLRVKDVTPTTESLMEDDSFLFGAWARPGSNQRCGDSKIPHGHLGATDFPRFNYLEALARLEVGKPVGKMCVLFLVVVVVVVVAISGGPQDLKRTCLQRLWFQTRHLSTRIPAEPGPDAHFYKRSRVRSRFVTPDRPTNGYKRTPDLLKCSADEEMDGEPDGCFQELGYPQIIHFNRVCHYKPSILGYPNFWKHLDMNKLKADLGPDTEVVAGSGRRAICTQKQRDAPYYNVAGYLSGWP